MIGRAKTGKAKPAESDDRKKERDETLERELEQSFPASDPPSSTQPGTRSGAPNRGDDATLSDERPSDTPAG